MTSDDRPGTVRDLMYVERPADTHLSQSSTPGGSNALLRDDDNHLVTQAVLYPAGDTLTRDEAEAMVKLAAAAAATAGLVAGIAVAKAAPHAKRGLATLKSKLNRSTPETAVEAPAATIEVEFPARTTMLKQPSRELTTP
ncbi:hypothetical protein ABZV61_42760 [Streptomyces sp900116325]|uniref:Transmembrane protein n=1 Tax=Streptomyces sp. 900116325 TaxID=3154295 RepID=A0ABV2UN18_9ACTN